MKTRLYRAFSCVLMLSLGIAPLSAAEVIEIPDPNLRAAIELALNKRAGAAITVDDMATLTELTATNANISDLSGLEFATNLRGLYLGGEMIAEDVWVNSNWIWDLSPIAGLTHLAELGLDGNEIADISALSGLTNLTILWLDANWISDLSPIAGLTHLAELDLGGNEIEDISALSGLTNLTILWLDANWISDLSPIAGLTHLTELDLGGNEIADISALSGLTNLTILWLDGNEIEDISPLVANTGWGNEDHVVLFDNPLSDTSIHTHIPTLQSRGVTVWFDDTPVTMTTATVSVSPASVPSPPIGEQLTLALNITDGETVAGYEATLQFDTSALRYVKSSNGDFLPAGAFFVPPVVTENQVTLASSAIAAVGNGDGTLATITFEVVAVKASTLTLSKVGLVNPDGTLSTPKIEKGAVTVSRATTDATVSVSPASVPSPPIGEQLTLALNITDGETVAGYEATLQFDTSALRYVKSSNGDFLPAGAFFVPPVVTGNQVTLASSAIAAVGNGDGTLATITFEVVKVKASTLTLSKVGLVNPAGTLSIPKIENGAVTERPKLVGDVNGDGVVNIQDLVIVGANFGRTGANKADVDGNGVVNIVDLVKVAGAFGQTAAAPALHSQARAMLIDADVEGWLAQARGLDLTDATMQRGIIVLEHLLAVLTPKETALLPNYPNPFNPETWIPYHLAHGADVSLTIYNKTGAVVRRFELGHQPAGFYTTRTQATYWDGRNESGEPVASGVYFYQLRAGNYSAVRRLVILK